MGVAVREGGERSLFHSPSCSPSVPLRYSPWKRGDGSAGGEVLTGPQDARLGFTQHSTVLRTTYLFITGVEFEAD